MRPICYGSDFGDAKNVRKRVGGWTNNYYCVKYPENGMPNGFKYFILVVRKGVSYETCGMGAVKTDAKQKRSIWAGVQRPEGRRVCTAGARREMTAQRPLFRDQSDENESRLSAALDRSADPDRTRCGIIVWIPRTEGRATARVSFDELVLPGLYYLLGRAGRSECSRRHFQKHAAKLW